MTERNRREREALETLREALASVRGRQGGTYQVPPTWLDPEAVPGEPVPVDPGAAWLGVVGRILAAPRRPLTPAAGHPAGWTGRARVYNLFVRSGLAWDHDGDGRLALEPGPAGWRESGTLVKAVALLPHVAALGCDTVHLLPVAARGRDGHKGTLGSPYAVRDPYRVEPTLAEPALGLDADALMAAFVAAAHHLGLRVVVEFVFRTASPDSDWVREHPEWFYWIDADRADRPPGSTDPELYGSPIFAPEELETIRRRVEEEGAQGDLPPPPAAFRAQFAPPPATVEMRGGRFIGRGADGRELRVATAFADWPPDDSQPPWTDAAYLRLYADPDFDYVAYNTVRMYDHRLATPTKAQEELWERIVGILPAWQERFFIDGVMIDMGHALPAPLKGRMVERARRGDGEFAFWDEKFPVEAASVAEGYNAVIGYSWYATCRSDELRRLLERCAGERLALPFLATAESHNSPRAAARPGGLGHSRGAFALLCALPAVPWIHGGFELGETRPVNTGLDFTPEEAAAWPAEALPLFSAHAYPWNRETGLIPWVRTCLALRQEHQALIADPDPATCHLLPVAGRSVVALHRGDGHNGLLLVANLDWQEPTDYALATPGGVGVTPCRLTGRHLAPDDQGLLSGVLEPGAVLWLEMI